MCRHAPHPWCPASAPPMFDRWEQGTISWLEIQRLGSALAFPTLLDVMRRKAAHDAGGNDSDGAQLSFKSFKRLLHSPAVAEQLDLVSEYHTAAYQYRVVEKVLQLLVQGHVQVAELSEARLAYAYHSEHCYGLRCDRRTLIEMRIMRIIWMEPAAALLAKMRPLRGLSGPAYTHTATPNRRYARRRAPPRAACNRPWTAAGLDGCCRRQARPAPDRGPQLYPCVVTALPAPEATLPGDVQPPFLQSRTLSCSAYLPGLTAAAVSLAAWRCSQSFMVRPAHARALAGPRASPAESVGTGHPCGQAEPCVLLLLASGCWVQSFWTCLSCASASTGIVRGWCGHAPTAPPPGSWRTAVG
jgi:hypothetical protein